jgi:dihydroorotase
MNTRKASRAVLQPPWLGFTAIACMANTNPVNDDAAVTEYIRDKARAVGLVQVFPIGAVSVGLAGERLQKSAS